MASIIQVIFLYFKMKIFYLENSFHELNVEIEKMTNQLIDNRIFYFSIPPNVFVDVARTIKKSSMSKVIFLKKNKF